MSHKFLIHSNNTPSSKSTEEFLRQKLEMAGIPVSDALEDDVDLIICIGGDGALLRAVHDYDFPTIPFMGINTGHLGFFQEIAPDELDMFIEDYLEEEFSIQPMMTIKAIVEHDDTRDEFTALNEVAVKSNGNHTVHLDISIGGGLIESFSGDGVLISTPAGSTAYNYSLRGSIVDPRLELLQVTPIAPMNSTAYRSFTSSILLPPDLSLGIVPGVSESICTLLVTHDSFSEEYENVSKIEVKLSDQKVNLLRFGNYDFWSKVKEKFL
ncbi:MAG: NAD(+)/NADH kinase [Firmicutes bacterium]|nr:NAD(+)/NADH kinase [Bacillota bacterium]